MNNRLPTHGELESLAREIATKMATNQSEAWARLIHQVGVFTPPDWTVRCIWLVEAISRLSPVGIGHERRNWLVSNDEAFILGYTGTKMSAEACVMLAYVCYQLEQVLGADHAAILPIRWQRKGALKRASNLSIAKAGEAETWNR